MKHCVLLLFVLSTGVLCARAQTATPTPITSATPRQRLNFPTSRDVNERFNQLNALETPRTRVDENANPLGEIEQKFYRKSNKKEVQILAPAPSLLEKYAAFLRQSDAGIVKLNADSTCVESPEIIVAKEDCLSYTMPGAGTAYSFRIESYRLPRLADLILAKNVLKTDGILQQGIMVNIGNVPLEEVSLQSKGMKYLLDFKPAEDGAALLKTGEQLSKGVKADGFVYGMGVYVKTDTTFVLRSIAYKGKFMRSIKGVTYNELDFDKRRDIVVAFRLIDKEANGNVTILWKILSRENAPPLKLGQAAKK